MRLLKTVVAGFMILGSSSAFAMFCPNNFNAINIGDTIDQVQKQCGKASSQKASTSRDDQPQEWIYFVKEQPTDQATVKMSIAFDKGVITNMSVNGIGLSTTQICAGNLVAIGSTQEAVKTACNSPAYISESNTPEAEADVNKIIVLTYKGTPDVDLEFENGKLKSRK
jgi:hypothetical protein